VLEVCSVCCLNVADSQLAVRFQPVFSLSCFQSSSSSYMFKQPAVLTVTITSHLVNAVTIDSVAVSLLPTAVDTTDAAPSHRVLQQQTSRSSDQSQVSAGSADSANILDLYSRGREVVRQSSLPVDLVEYVELDADRHTLSSCGLVCPTVMRPSPATPAPFRERVITRRGDWSAAFTASDCVLQPGDNTIQLITQASFPASVNLSFHLMVTVLKWR